MRNRIPETLASAALILAGCAAVQPAGAQTFSVVYTFTGGADGANPFANLLLSGGVLYGTTSGGGAQNAGTVFTVNTTTKAETVLHSFAGGRTDGSAPLGGLIANSAGNLFGTTYTGGAHNFGTVFKIPAAGGSLTILHSFKGPPSEGSGPSGTLVMDHAGNIYGTTYSGGDTSGYGTTFEITAGGTYSTGQSFSPDGALPRAGLFLSDGILYGTTYGGGAHLFGGTVFQVEVTKPLYTFTGGADGSQPEDSLIGDGEGNLYGTAAGGGDGSFGNGHGVVFELNPTTGQETVLYTFTGPDGSSPTGALVRDGNGNFYGTTTQGGAFGHGTVFELSGGTLTTLYNFTGGADGGNPFAGVLLDSSGNVWGVAANGGSAAAPGGSGVVFEITPDAPLP